MERNYYIVLDTETANGYMTDGKLDLTDSMTYDIGWAVIDKKGNVYERRSFVVEEIFFGCPYLMQTAYYANKLPQYYAEIRNGSRLVKCLKSIQWYFKHDAEQYNIKAVMMHNASFDVRALNNTIRWLTNSRNRYFFPYGLKIWDTLKMSRDTICKQKTYIAFCEKYGFMTAHATPRPRATAEVLYRYITGNIDFIECHTGLEDVLIEKEIFVKCLRQHKAMRKALFD